MLRCDQRGTAAVIETCLPNKYQPTGTKTALDLFAEDILKTTKLEYIVTNPEYRQTIYHSLSGDTLKLSIITDVLVNGEKVGLCKIGLCIQTHGWNKR